MSRPLQLVCLLLALCALLAACAPAQKQEETFYALDTYVTFTVYDKDGAAVSAARARLSELEDLWSITRAKSELSEINARLAPRVSEDTLALWQTGSLVWEQTGGAFDLTVAPLVSSYGYYDKNYRVPSEEELRAGLLCVGMHRVEAADGSLVPQEGQRLDFGGIAKGYIADACAETLRAHGVTSAILSLGGNVRALGTKPDGKPFTVAVTDPRDTGAYLGTVKLADASLVTAGAYQRGFSEGGVYYHHILDPKTGLPADSGLLSVTVLCADGARADALSTACFVLGEEQSLRLFREAGDFELILVREDGTVVATEGLEGIFEASGKSVVWAKKNEKNA